MLVRVDIDNTICVTNGSEYKDAIANQANIDKINKLYEAGHNIEYWTARGGNSKKDWTDLTYTQLNKWGCKYHRLIMNKPSFDLLIDDKTARIDEIWTS